MILSLNQAKEFMHRHKWAEVSALTLAIIVASGVLYHTHKHAVMISQETIELQNKIDDFNQKAVLVNNMQYRPIQQNQVTDVQQNIVALAQQYSLNIISIKQLTSNETGQTFEIQLSGGWANSAYFLENLKVKDALIGMRSLALNVENGATHTVLQYKIYTK